MIRKVSSSCFLPVMEKLIITKELGQVCLTWSDLARALPPALPPPPLLLQLLFYSCQSTLLPLPLGCSCGRLVANATGAIAGGTVVATVANAWFLWVWSLLQLVPLPLVLGCCSCCMPAVSLRTLSARLYALGFSLYPQGTKL